LNNIDLRQCFNNTHVAPGDPDDNPLITLGINSQYYDIDELHKMREHLFETDFAHATALHINIQSLPAKYNKLLDLLIEFQNKHIHIDFILLCETFLHEKNKELFGEEFSVHQVPHIDKCTFCYHRITKGLEPACVATCPTDCRMWTDLNNPDDPVAQMVLSGRAKPLAEHLGTNPKVYYIALDTTKKESVFMEEVYSTEKGGEK